MNKLCLLAASALAAAASAAPSVSVSSVARDGDAIVVSYSLEDGPAVVTFSAKTNGADVAGRSLWTVSGDVNRYVDASSCTFRWTPDFPAAASAAENLSLTVTAWALDDTPDYMVVDLTAASAQRVKYYPSRDQLPGGDHDPLYRTGALLMRKCPASGVQFTMGAENESSQKNEGAHAATLAHSFYIGVFETTQTQWALVMQGASWSVSPVCLIEGAMRPMEGATYYHVREDCSNTASTAYRYPAGPCPDSFMGRLRLLSACAQFPDGIDFDLPGEAQWEYAARAGNGEGLWGNGETARSSNVPGRFLNNQAEKTAFTEAAVATFGPTNGTAVCGSYAPNAWGIYDMHGNVWEWCLDWYAADITALGGAVNASGVYLADGVTTGTDRVRRGGSWYNGWADLRSARRLNRAPGVGISWVGFRACCRGGLK